MTVGAGVADPPVLNGLNGIEPIATSVGPAAPVAGVFLRIPIGGKAVSDCDHIMQLSVAQIKLQQAIQLLELGLITQEQMEEVAEQSYKLISRP